MVATAPRDHILGCMFGSSYNNHFVQVLFSEFVRVLVGERTGEVEGGVWGEVQEYESLCDQQAQHIGRILRKLPKKHHASARTRQVRHINSLGFTMYTLNNNAHTTPIVLPM